MGGTRLKNSVVKTGLPEKYRPKNHIRIITAASLFDGHDAAINVMRRIIQATGAEVIHLGHDRSVVEVVDAAIQEDVQAIAMTSYQGGHMEYFKYMYDLLHEKGNDKIKIFGGGGGTILPAEIKELHAYGIARLYHPDDGREMGLQGMINDLLQRSDFPTGLAFPDGAEHVGRQDHNIIANMISAAENNCKKHATILDKIAEKAAATGTPVLGITGTGGAGKSSLVDELLRRYLRDFKDKTIGIVSVDPTKRRTGGALLGDRIRMNSVSNKRCFMRSMATRQVNLSLADGVHHAVNILKAAGYDLIILETSGIGQSDTEIIDHSDLCLYVMTPEYGAATQLEKIDMLDFADLVAINKSDKRGAEDALRDVTKQYRRNHNLFDENTPVHVYGTVASKFNDPGMNTLYANLMKLISQRSGRRFDSQYEDKVVPEDPAYIIPPKRVRYLSEISESIRRYDRWVEEQAAIAEKAWALETSTKAVEGKDLKQKIKASKESMWNKLSPECRQFLNNWSDLKEAYGKDFFVFEVRKRALKVKTHKQSLSGTEIPKVSLPKYKDWGTLLRWGFQENVPGSFPFTSGVFPFKREGEDPTRMFAGEGGPERTNKRFHYVSTGMPAKRLSTAFDSVTLYGRNPDNRPDIYGKIGNSGVSICCVDDAKKLYSGFDLCDPATSVSMTINGPAPMILAFFINAAIDQQCEKYIREQGLTEEVSSKIESHYKKIGVKCPRYNQKKLPVGNDGLGLLLLGTSGDQVLAPEAYNRCREHALQSVRGTVQADILKEDQAQNTCIFSTEFALRLMGDVQAFFNENNVRNFYSVSISGYHIAEAGANPITQLAFTLANGFTYVEYYLSRGMDIDDFAPNLSFFFSNGLDPEYAVIGRVARRIWAKALREKYGANTRSQKLKYHIQTSGRSLHAQEIGFNDIRTTLQALYAIYDNCNSLHTNAYDEAITTPTEESVRRAMAIQLIINHELGQAYNENPIQGSFIIEELTDLVEEAVLVEFDRITDRGGVLGAMETMYQRGKIQEESLYYETLKHSGAYPVIGVNTFLSSEGSPTIVPGQVIRATEQEKKDQIATIKRLEKANKVKAASVLKEVQQAAAGNQNIFESLVKAAPYCSLGQLTNALFDVGGQYRRNM